MKKFILLVLVLSVFPLSGCISGATEKPTKIMTKAELGQSLFFDTNLSANRTQSCATCHSPEQGFADPRNNGVKGAVSLGDDGHSLGDRNAPNRGLRYVHPSVSAD